MKRKLSLARLESLLCINLKDIVSSFEREDKSWITIEEGSVNLQKTHARNLARRER